MKKIILTIFILSIGFLSAQNIDYKANRGPIGTEQLQIYSNKSSINRNYLSLKNYRFSNPLVLINDEKFPFEKLKDINSEDIETMEVLKGEEAVNLYGEEAKDGVIIIKAKNNYQFRKARRAIEKEPIIAI